MFAPESFDKVCDKVIKRWQRAVPADFITAGNLKYLVCMHIVQVVDGQKDGSNRRSVQFGILPCFVNVVNLFQKCYGITLGLKDLIALSW